MRIILFIIAFFVGTALYAQYNIGDNYIFTKEQHDQIKKNLNDYRNLIKSFDTLNTKFKMLVQQYELIKSIKNQQDIKIKELNIEVENFKSQTIAFENLQYQNQNLKSSYEKLQHDISVLNNRVVRQEKSIDYWRHKYNKRNEHTTVERAIIAFVYGSMIGGALLAIYFDIVKHN